MLSIYMIEESGIKVHFSVTAVKFFSKWQNELAVFQHTKMEHAIPVMNNWPHPSLGQWVPQDTYIKKWMFILTIFLIFRLQIMFLFSKLTLKQFDEESYLLAS